MGTDVHNHGCDELKVGTGPNKARGPGGLRARPRSPSTAHLLSQEGTEGTSSNTLMTGGPAARLPGSRAVSWCGHSQRPGLWGPRGCQGALAGSSPCPARLPPHSSHRSLLGGEGSQRGIPSRGGVGGPDREELVLRSRAGFPIGGVDGLRLRRHGGSLRWLRVVTR